MRRNQREKHYPMKEKQTNVDTRDRLIEKRTLQDVEFEEMAVGWPLWRIRGRTRLIPTLPATRRVDSQPELRISSRL
jgi:hypothetical protein